MAAQIVRPNPCFSLGHVVATPGAIDALNEVSCPPISLLSRHQRKDWGDLDEEDKEANNDALKTGARIFSAYIIRGIKFWVISDAEDDQGKRAVTTILLPEEY